MHDLSLEPCLSALYDVYVPRKSPSAGRKSLNAVETAPFTHKKIFHFGPRRWCKHVRHGSFLASTKYVSDFRTLGMGSTPSTTSTTGPCSLLDYFGSYSEVMLPRPGPAEEAAPSHQSSAGIV
jgi:hypothetical protein